MSMQESLIFDHNQRAEEYEEYYIKGKAAVSDKNSEEFTEDMQQLRGAVSDAVLPGTLADIPCGSAYWMDTYASKADRILLVDESALMLKKARERAVNLGCLDRCRFKHSDLFAMNFLDESVSTVIIGLFLSHIPIEDEHLFFSFLKGSLQPGGRVILLDSVWAENQEQERKKEGFQTRSRPDGSSIRIYKRFFTRGDIFALGAREGMQVDIPWFGEKFFAAVLSEDRRLN